MADWRRDLTRLAGDLAKNARRSVRAIDQVVGRDPFHIMAYAGYGTGERALILARVLRREALSAADHRAPLWQNLIHTFVRIDAKPLPRARVVVRHGGTERALTADDEGFIRGWIPTGGVRTVTGTPWQPFELELPAGSHGPSSRSVAEVLVPSDAAELGVISDMDDTVLQSEVTNFLRAARLMLLENARTRLPFPGVAAFYRALRSGSTGPAENPIFYVSSSPWNLYDVIRDFLTAQRIPSGPLMLRDWDIGRALLSNAPHKTAVIHEILDTYPRLPFILIGDSAQEDPEIYSEVVTRYPRRIRAVYIRNVSASRARSAAIERLMDRVRTAGSTLVLADDTLAAARHAAAHGWISSASLGEIGEEKRADTGVTGEKVSAPGETKEGAGPTIIIDPTDPADRGRRSE
jgi:phosphatidate phosphatase APP1